MVGDETADLPGLPEGVEAIAVAGPNAPLEDADVLVVPSTVRVDGTAAARLRRCKLVITTTSGFDHVDLQALQTRRIDCARLPLARRDAVVETTLGMMLSLTRRLGRFQQAALDGRWERKNLADYGAALGTVGAVGVGVIGSRMATLLEAMGVRALRDPLPAGVALPQLLDESEVHASLRLTVTSRGLIGRDEIRRLPRRGGAEYGARCSSRRRSGGGPGTSVHLAQVWTASGGTRGSQALRRASHPRHASRRRVASRARRQDCRGRSDGSRATRRERNSLPRHLTESAHSSGTP